MKRKIWSCCWLIGGIAWFARGFLISQEYSFELSPITFIFPVIVGVIFIAIGINIWFKKPKEEG